MTSGTDILDAVVIGAGWAGLGVSHALTQRGLRHRVLERGRIGETWRTQRWDSFRVNTPNIQTVMPGDTYDGPDPDGAMTSGEFVALLEDYADRYGLPVETGTPVTDLVASDDLYRLAVPRGALWARNVVIASSNQNCPARPPFSALLPPEVQQIDASAYRNASGLDSGAVLVVGSAQSGGQIAEDLVQAGRTVFLATSRVGRLPRMYRGRHISVWMVLSGLIDVTRRELLQQGPIPGRPLTGALHTISLQSLSAQGVVLLGRLTGVDDGRLSFSDDAEEHVRLGDEGSARVRSQIDEFIARNGIDAPEAEPDPAEVIGALLPNPPVRSIDLAARGITTVIWCTGFRGDFGWVCVPDVLDAQGQPLHEKGFASVPGVYFAGLPFSISRRSGTILAIAEEAALLVEDIQRRLDNLHLTSRLSDAESQRIIIR
ncbi:MAG: FAD-dependent oxidoreductase [Mesorhizobium sp.]|uniref:flavin-containing monooxygenase n=1 Tax=unclassified Mesorhizobium TaxID=325217 RepID=UPI000FCA7880|nr:MULTISPECIES: NAD(P)/FAD-dependent oxidoreductase [unclassified Mesorhizobium]RUV73124.1 FAD-dependent oxidoreductase [Mesorhizobium sp. M5C.F.Cr.IN.023.01.1.1]RWF86098.1 MAG: FAD-dependent oxidoreductase [Mesorhizobium sp.]RWF92865.1 MAG: FAD-dependent oxidoreductase [Mesorhizobium sp.]RWI39480.1 MAG: FAD-dependent oxidoreductase [Mesorhizobium sp.]RWI44949.1 MAG: FAD-dependent oxidoreductase [Mesorhizobium sp.]